MRCDDARGSRHAGAARARGDRGAVLVEFALVLPLLVTLLLGMLSGGLAYNQKQQLTHATREGARYGATLPQNQIFSGSGVTWQSAVRDVVVDRALGDLSVSGATVCVSLVKGSSGNALDPLVVVDGHSTSGAPCIPTQTYAVTASDKGVRVQIAASRPSEIQMGLFGVMHLTVKSSATALSEASL